MSTYWIFIAVCGIILSIAKKNQNKQRKRASIETPTPDAQSPQTELERQLRELLHQNPVHTTTSTYPIPNKNTQKSTTVKRKTANMPQTKNIIANNNHPKAEPQKNNHPNEQIEGILEDFSMEKAVIYSEILKPKYEEY